VRRIHFTATLLLLLAGQASFGQVLSPSGSFTKDSLKIGEEVDYSLSIRYPRNIDVVFPDSTYSFLPFEFISKTSFPTKSDSLYSFDSAVYTFATFEVDSLQLMNLPIFMVTDGDSLAIRPGSDSIYLVHVVKSIPDSISMIENTDYSNVKLGFNYPYLIVVITTLAIVSFIVLMVFGKTIRKKITLYRLKRMHKLFMEKFNSALRELGSDNDYRYFEHLLVDWKGYMEKLNKSPYTKLTSQEIQDVYPDGKLNDSLQTIDKAIYGHFKVSELPGSFDYLRRVSEDSFHTKTEEIRNG